MCTPCDMVNEISEVPSANHCLDYQVVQSGTTNATTTNSSLDSESTFDTKGCANIGDGPDSKNQLNAWNFDESAGTLTWSFLNHVDSLDNRPKKEGSSSQSTPSSVLSTNECQLLVSALTTARRDVDLEGVRVFEGMPSSTLKTIQRQQSNSNKSSTQALHQSSVQGHKPPCSKTNGHALNVATTNSREILSNEILPQTANTQDRETVAAATTTINNLNFILSQQKLSSTITPTATAITGDGVLEDQAAVTGFVFTSPTSTIKRKKLQQQLFKREQQYNDNHTERKDEKANENSLKPKESVIIPALYDYDNQNGSHGTLRQPSTIPNHSTNINNNKSNKSKEQQETLQHTNETKVAMISSSTGVIITDTVALANHTPSLIGSGSGCGSEHIAGGSEHIAGGSGSVSGGGGGSVGRRDHNGTTRILKTHTLPPALAPGPTKHNNYNSSADGVDLVDDTKTDFHTKLHKTRRLRKHNRMGGLSSNNSLGGRGGSGSGGGSEADCSAAIKGLPNNGSLLDDIEMHLGLIGWRKKCLYTLLLLLILLIVTNLVLTLWILKVMEFSTEGMGPLKIVPSGIQLTGQAIIMDVLRASTIRSRHGQPISIESSRNFSINTRDMNGALENHLFLGHDKLECLAKGFRINDTAGRNLFSVNRNEVTIGAHALRIEGEGGAIFRESIQTPHIRAEPGRELRLESPTRQLGMTAAKDINLQSRAGGIELTALKDIKLSALDGSVRFESTKIFMPNLRTAQLPLPGASQSREHLHRVFQLCACSNGKLFLAAPHSICAGDDTSVCR